MTSPDSVVAYINLASALVELGQLTRGFELQTEALRMTERFGSKRIWMISVSLFGLGSALCGLAWSAESLIFFRVLQGFGGGMIMPVGMALLAQTAGPARVGRVKLVQVYAIQPQALQAAIHGAAQVLWPAVLVPAVAAGTHESALGGDDKIS